MGSGEEEPPRPQEEVVRLLYQILEEQGRAREEQMLAREEQRRAEEEQRRAEEEAKRYRELVNPLDLTGPGRL